MNEQLLHFIWKFGLFDKSNLKSTEGDLLEIIHPGVYNTDAGADFQNAKIRDGKTVWAGSVEVHIHAKDWNTHRHHQDKAYNNVILHVVFDKGKEHVFNQDGKTMHVLELKDRIRPEFLSRYEELKLRNNWIPCQKFFSEVDEFVVTNFLERLAVERLENKVEQIKILLASSKNDWEQVMFVMVAGYLGASINKEPFMHLAQTLPVKIWAKHRDDSLQLEALVFGQAGFLESPFDDKYPNQLRKEYLYLKRLYGLQPLEKHEWKFLRLRPANFPTLRLAQLAALMNKEVKFFSHILDSQNAMKIQEIFEVEVSDYWKSHYVFNKPVKSVKSHLGSPMKNILLINAVAPVLFAYGKYKDDERYCELALRLLETAEAEDNAVIKRWKQLGLKPKHTLDTQAMLQLKNGYCDQFRCLECSIGNKILK